MTFEEAIRKSIKSYFKGKNPEKVGAIKKFRYTKKYMDRFEEAQFGSKHDYLKNDGKTGVK